MGAIIEKIYWIIDNDFLESKQRMGALDVWTGPQVRLLEPSNGS